MKRKFFSALLFGALLVASTSTFVSCKNYDDDISDLRSQITSNATDLKSLVDEKNKNVEAEIAALKSQSDALDAAYKSADNALNEAIKTATNDAEGYAQIQAAEAQKAAIAAAKQLVDDAVNNLQSALDKANEAIESQGKTVTALLAADTELQKGIDKAQARADAAYTLAEQASKQATDATDAATQAKKDAATVADNLKQINTTLSGQIKLLGDTLDGVKKTADQNAVDIQKQADALKQLKDDNQKALDALSAEDKTLQGLIEKNQNGILGLQDSIVKVKASIEKALTDAEAYTDKEVDAAKKDINDGIDTKINDLKSAYAAADATLKTEIINELQPQITKNSDDIKSINIDIKAINEKLYQLINSNVNNLITSIIYQGANNYNVYAKVANGTDVVFAAADASHPTAIDASKAEIALENSLGDANPAYKLGKATPAQKVLLTRSTSKNGLWTIPVTSIQTYTKPNVDDKALYALTTTYPQDTLNAEGKVVTVTKKVYSHYAINKNAAVATKVDASLLSLIGCGKNLDKSPASGVDIQFTALDGQLVMGTSDNRVYKKFIECTKVLNSKGDSVTNGASTFNKANAGKLYTILNADNNGGNDTIDVTCPEGFKNYKVYIKYYIWNYDGSRKTIEKVVVFNQNLWGPDNTTITSEPTSSADQTALSTQFPNFEFVKGTKCSNGTTWSQEAYSVEATTSQAAMNGAKIILQSSDKSTDYETINVGSAKANLSSSVANLAKIKNMSVVYNPLNPKVNTDYTITLSFYDKNGFKVNIVNITFKMTIPTGKPNPWHIAAAFDSKDKLTIAWADYATPDASNTIAKYAFSGSFYKVDEGYKGDAYMFKLTNADDYNTGKTNAKYKPTVLPEHNTYLMSVPNAAVQDEHVYSMTAGIKFFGLYNLISYNADGGWADNFDIEFLSPIKYAIIGTKGHIDNKTYAGMTNTTPITVDYRNSVTVNNSFFYAIDPKEAATTQVKFFENKDNRIVSTSLDFADVNSNNALFSKIETNADGTYTLVTSDKVSMTGDTKVAFKLTVKDVWGVVTTYNFNVTVKANQ